MMERFEAQDNNSGWFLGCIDREHNHNDPQNLRRVSLYDIACGMLMCVPFLPLPQGVLVEIKDSRFIIIYNGQNLIPKPNSFIENYLIMNSKRLKSR
jgi:hypothetical protein